MAQHADEPRPLVWRGSSKSDFVRFPAAAQREMAQMGERHPTMAKTLKGFSGGTVVEIRESYDGSAYRDLYCALRGCSLRAARVPEEIEKRDHDAQG